MKKGYDLVRVGNVNGVAFFHERTTKCPPKRKRLLGHVIEVLEEVSRCFDYNPQYVERAVQ